jgi:hypothetical protein
LDELDENEGWVFHSHVGDTLELDVVEKWGVEEFHAVIGNPPYQNFQESNGKRGGGDLLWNKFVIVFLKQIIKNGYLLFIHPSGWRKPESEHSKYKGLFELMTKKNQMLYLEIHNTADGIKTFGCGTRYDWYVLQNTPLYKNTTIKDENGDIKELNLKEWEFLPNYNFTNIYNILNRNNESCNILFNVSLYETRKKWVSNINNAEFKYPLIHATLKDNKIRYYYTNDNTKGFFGISKIIFGETGINTPILDINGEYGMTQQTMAIQIDNIEEGENIKNALMCTKFKEVINACMWSNYRIDWRLFTMFRKDFWKEFI